MFRWLPAPLKGLFSWFGITLLVIFWCIPLYTFAVLKLIIPIKASKEFWARRLNWVGECWVSCNMKLFYLTQDIQWISNTLPELSPDRWYFIASNHQSWVDVLIIQSLFQKKVPFIKFFAKDTLKYVPLMGLAWWAFEFPMMKRYSQKTLKKKPHLRGRDIETTLKLCQKFIKRPTALLSFLEGTRFTPKKHKKLKSPYKHLLPPKPGGFALSTQALQPHIKSFIDVTIVYPNDRKTFWQFLCGKACEARILVEEIPIPEHFFYGDYTHDNQFRQELKDWLNDIWARKDAKIEETLINAPFGSPSTTSKQSLSSA